jgi:hypothetical protein
MILGARRRLELDRRGMLETSGTLIEPDYKGSPFVGCRRQTAETAERRGLIYACRWVDRQSRPS